MTVCYRPVPGKVGQGFGENPTRGRPHPTFGDYQPDGHAGVDFDAEVGTPVIAPEDMKLTWADWGHKLPGDDSHPGWVSRYYLVKPNLGIGVIGETGAGAYVFAHLSRTDRNAGELVKAGEVIGYTGNTGLSTGPHLHVEWIPAPAKWATGRYGREDPVPRFTQPYRIAGKLTPQSVITPPRERRRP